MHNWFECTIKYEKVAEEGKVIKVSEKYLVDALTFTEAEERINKEMEPFISGEFQVSAMKRYKVNELFFNEEGSIWYRCKVNFIQLDEEKGVEKKIASIMLVQAESLKDARERLEESMEGSMADYDNASISETTIMDVYKYEA